VGVQELKGDKDGTEMRKEYTDLFGNLNETDNF
jgi:hypothetical protein